MASKKYLQLDATGVLAEDNVDLVLTSELAATTGAAGVGADSSSIANSSATNVQDILEDLDSAISGAGAVDSVNGLTGTVVITGQNTDTNHTAVNYTAASAAITDHIAGIDTVLASVAGGVNYKGNFDASAGDYTAISPADVGDLYKVSVAGTIGGVDWQVGDNLIVNKDVPGTVVAADVDKIDNTESVTSVNGQVGAVVLDGADIDTTATIDAATPAGSTVDDALNALNGAIKDNAKGDVIKGFLAGAAIAAGDPVYKSSATEVTKAESDQDTALEVIGIAAAAAAPAAAVDVIPFGPSGALYSGLTSGNPVFLSEAGGITETAPTTSGSYVLRIGKATSATDIDVEPKNVPVKLA